VAEDSTAKITERLCNEAYEPDNPKSPRCVVPQATHGGKPHRALRLDGTVVEWGKPPKP
jgi:hypothetical protein